MLGVHCGRVWSMCGAQGHTVGGIQRQGGEFEWCTCVWWVVVAGLGISVHQSVDGVTWVARPESPAHMAPSRRISSDVITCTNARSIGK